MIKPRCFIDNKELQEFGAILLSPPDKQGKIKKFHICIKHYKKIIDLAR